MSGFWGTHREEAWHRRKEKENERASAIRQEGEQTMARAQAIHNQELEKKESILDIARGLIRDARHDAACAKKKRSNSSCSSNAVASLKDDDGQEETTQQEDDGDAKMEASRKMKRVKMEEEEDEAVVASSGGVISDDMNNDRKPDAVLSSDLDGKGVAKVQPHQDEEPMKPDEPMDDSLVDKLLPESIKSGVPVPDAAASSSSSMLIMSKEEKDAEESVRENLLALSYAMFDTLYGSRSFQPKSFVQFLVNTGEKGLAEEIALAAIEKSNGSQEHVKFVLDKLVPTSQDAEHLVVALSDILGKQSGPASVGGKDYLAQWHLQKGNSDQAFAAALLMKSSVNSLKSEMDILTHALPLTTTALRRQELKAACPWLLSPNVIGVFTDEEWPDFMSSLIPFTPTNVHGGYHPPLDSYLMFASSSKMKAPRNVVIAAYYVEKVINQEIRYFKDIRSRPISGASYRISHGAHALVQEFVSIKTKMHDLTKNSISDLDSKFSKDSVRDALQKIGLDFKQEVIQRIGKEIVLPPVNECLAKHKNNMIALKCTKCKKAHMELAASLGLAQALKEHPTLAHQSAMIRQTYGLPYAPEMAKERVAGNHFDPEVVAALLGDNPSIYCKQTSTAGK